MQKTKNTNLSPRPEADGATLGSDPIGIGEGSKNDMGEGAVRRAPEPLFLNGSVKYAICPNCGCLCVSAEIKLWCVECKLWFFPEPIIDFPDHCLTKVEYGSY